MFLKKLYTSFPYYGPTSDKLEKELTTLIERYFPQINLKIAFINNFKIGSLFRSKDVLPVRMRSNIIYKYQCGDCLDSYIGLTSKTARFRWSQHLGISFRTLRPLVKIDFSPARKHAEDNNHSIDFNNFSILDYAKNNMDLKILESLHIHATKPSLNTATTSTKLYIVQ